MSFTWYKATKHNRITPVEVVWRVGSHVILPNGVKMPINTDKYWLCATYKTALDRLTRWHADQVRRAEKVVKRLKAHQDELALLPSVEDVLQQEKENKKRAEEAAALRAEALKKGEAVKNKRKRTRPKKPGSSMTQIARGKVKYLIQNGKLLIGAKI